MDLSFFNESINMIILGICLCVGYAIKNIIPTDKFNKYIPLIMLVLGTLLSIISNLSNITLETILIGMISGLASTGTYEMFKNLIGKEE